jgi:hypothetical protein
MSAAAIIAVRIQRMAFRYAYARGFDKISSVAIGKHS